MAQQDEPDGPPPPYEPPPPAPQPAEWHTVGSAGIFRLQASPGVPRELERTPVLVSGSMAEALAGLTSLPAEYREADLAMIEAGPEHHNSTLEYGPDANGDLWMVEHRSEQNWWLQSDVSAAVYTRRAKQPADGAYRLIAVHPTDPTRAVAVAVLPHPAVSSEAAGRALEQAEAWASRFLPAEPGGAYQMLAGNLSPALEDLAAHVSPPEAAIEPTSPAQRILADRAASNSTQPAAEELECPVCMEPIGEADAAMRCAGQAGVRHYFHAHCLSRWASTCRGNWSQASCPVCRGPVEVHAERLGDFLSGAASSELDTESRGMLSGLLGGLGKGWSGVSREQVAEGMGVLAGAGFGFWQGYNGRAPSTGSFIMDDLVWDNAPQSVRMAVIGGWIGGLGTRLVRYLTRSKDDDDD